MIHLSYILQGTSSFSAKGQIEEDPANTEGVKIKRLTSIENSFESSIRSNILFLHMTLLKELQAFCPSPISPRCRLGSEVVEQRQRPGVSGCSRAGEPPQPHLCRAPRLQESGSVTGGHWALGICSLPRALVGMH